MRKLCLFFLPLVFFPLFLIPLSLNALELVSLEINEEIIPGPEPITLTVTGTLSNGIKQQIREDLVWRTSDSSIANVSRRGTLTFTGKEGQVTIFVNKGAVSGKKTINVKAWPKSLSIESTLVYSENPYRLLVKGKFSDGTTRYYGPEDKITWFSTNPWVAWVNNEGIVTFTGEEGYVSIKAVSGAFSDSVNTTVTADKETKLRPKGIKIKEENIKYSSLAQQLTLVAIMHDGTEEVLKPESANWHSSNRDVANISGEGVLTFTGKPGFATIKVSFGGYHHERLLQVGRFLKKIKINQSLNYTPAWDNSPFQLSVTADYNDGSQLVQTTNLKWTSSDAKIAEITEDGMITFTGEAGTVEITVTGSGDGDLIIEDKVTVTVPPREKSNPRQLFINYNPISEEGFLTPQVYCIYENGEIREVTDQVEWSTLTPETASIYEGTIYFSPNPGQIKIVASFQGLTDTLTGYINGLNWGWGSGKYAQKTYQLRIKEHYVPFSFRPLQLTGLAIKGGGSVVDVSSQIRWYSSQPLVAKVEKGVLTFTGRVGKAIITAQGFGFRDSLTVEVRPEDLQPRVEHVEIEGQLVKGVNQLKAVAYFNDGSSKDVTAEAVWNTSNKNVAVVTETGQVMFLKGLAPITISAHYGDKGAEIERV
ncbi:MAG: hypothetical protein GX092_05255 [Clostridia bacterium]|nr:hypothetical protein [Clostridia bacterium]